MEHSDPRMDAVRDLLCERELEISAVELHRLWCGRVSLKAGPVILQTPNVYASQDIAIGGMSHFVSFLRHARAQARLEIERRPPGRAESFLMLGEVEIYA